MITPSVCDWYGVTCSFLDDNSTELSLALVDPIYDWRVGNNFAGDFSAAISCLTTSPGLPANTFVVQLYVGNDLYLSDAGTYFGNSALSGSLPAFSATVFDRLRQVALFGSGVTGTLQPFSTNPLLNTLKFNFNPGITGPIPSFSANPLLTFVNLAVNNHSGTIPS